MQKHIEAEKAISIELLSSWALAFLEYGIYCWDFHFSLTPFHQMWVYLTLKICALTTLHVQEIERYWPTCPLLSSSNGQFNRDLEGRTKAGPNITGICTITLQPSA